MPNASAYECVPGMPCRKVLHPDDYSIGGVAVHLNVGGAWTCDVHGGGQDGSILVDWGTTEISLDAIAAVRELGRDADGLLPDDVADMSFIRTPVRVSILARVNDDLDEGARRRVATRLAGVVLARVEGASDLDLFAEVDLRMADGDGVSGWPTGPDEEAALIDRAGWAAAGLLSARGSALGARACSAGMWSPDDYGAPHVAAAISTDRRVWLEVGIASEDGDDSEPWILECGAVEGPDDFERLIALVERKVDIDRATE